MDEGGSALGIGICGRRGVGRGAAPPCARRSADPPPPPETGPSARASCRISASTATVTQPAPQRPAPGNARAPADRRLTAPTARPTQAPPTASAERDAAGTDEARAAPITATPDAPRGGTHGRCASTRRPMRSIFRQLRRPRPRPGFRSCRGCSALLAVVLGGCSCGGKSGRSSRPMPTGPPRTPLRAPEPAPAPGAPRARAKAAPLQPSRSRSPAWSRPACVPGSTSRSSPPAAPSRTTRW